MRIIAGRYKGMRLHFPKSTHLRPTQDRVKEGLFSALSVRCEKANVLDLFCGSGSLGLEALSRGALSVCFVDKDTRYVNRNLDTIDDNVDVVKKDVLGFLKTCNQSFDLIFLDPPWQSCSLFDRSLMAISEFGILKHSGMVVCEHPIAFTVSQCEGFSLFRSYRYGNTRVTILEYNESNLSG